MLDWKLSCTEKWSTMHLVTQQTVLQLPCSLPEKLTLRTQIVPSLHYNYSNLKMESCLSDNQNINSKRQEIRPSTTWNPWFLFPAQVLYRTARTDVIQKCGYFTVCWSLLQGTQVTLHLKILRQWDLIQNPAPKDVVKWEPQLPKNKH